MVATPSSIVSIHVPFVQVALIFISLSKLARSACNARKCLRPFHSGPIIAEGEIEFAGLSRTLGSAADGAGITAHGDSLALLLDVLEELDGTLELPAVDGLGSLAGVLERHTQVGTAGAGRLGGNDLGGSVPNLIGAKKVKSASHSPGTASIFIFSLSFDFGVDPSSFQYMSIHESFSLSPLSKFEVTIAVGRR